MSTLTPMQPAPSPPAPLPHAVATRDVGTSTPRGLPSPRREVRPPFHEKVFVVRNSLLSDMINDGSAGEAAGSLYHFALASLCWLFVSLLLQHNRDSGVHGAGAAALAMGRSLATTAHSVFGGLHVAAAAVLALHCLALLVVPAAVWLLRRRKSGDATGPPPRRWALRLFAVCDACLVVALFALGAATCLLAPLSPGSGVIVMSEAGRLAMKVHSYSREKLVHGVTAAAERWQLERLLAARAKAVASEGAADTCPMTSPAANSDGSSGLQRRSRAARRASVRSRIRADLERSFAPPGGEADADSGYTSESETSGPSPALAPAVAPSAATAPTPVPASAPALQPPPLSSHIAALVRFRDYVGPRLPLAVVKASQPSITIGSCEEEARRYVYFLFSPTLIYRDEYPRSGSLNLAAVAVCLANFVASVVFGLLLLEALVLPTLARGMPGGRLPSTAAALFIVVFENIAATFLLFVVTIFFGVLHSWLGLWSELLRFGDRRFYSTWWASRTWGEFYRRWNSVVGEWIHAYLLLDCKRAGASNAAALAFVFLVSATAHELVLVCAFRFFFPVLFLLFVGPGSALIWLTRFFPTRFSNVFLWLALSLGLSLLFVLYAIEGQLRAASPPEGLYDVLVPRLWRVLSALWRRAA